MEEFEKFLPLAEQSGMLVSQLTDVQWRVTHPLRRWPLNLYFSSKRQTFSMSMEMPKEAKPFTAQSAINLLLKQPKLRRPFAHPVVVFKPKKPSCAHMSGGKMWDLLCQEMRQNRKWSPPDWALAST